MRSLRSVCWSLSVAALSLTLPVVLAGCALTPLSPVIEVAPPPVYVAPAPVAAQPARAWEVSRDGVTWAPVNLPDTQWGCDNCTRYYRTTMTGVPRAVRFRWASDNKARMFVNGRETFNAFWQPSFCTDKPCCSACCDSPSNCMRNLSTWYTLPPQTLTAFTAGQNQIVWEVFQESGGSGFYAEMSFE